MFRLAVLFFTLIFLFTEVSAKNDHQVGVKFGMTSIDNEDGWNFENGTLFTDFLYDTPTVIDPRFDIGYISLDEDDNDGVGSLWQFSVNGIYDIEIEGCKYTRIFSPYLLAGLGYEYVSDDREAFESHPFVQAGFGANYNLTDNIDIVTEFKALQILDNDDSDEDNEFTVLFGFRVPLFVNVIRGQEVEETTPIPIPIPVSVKQQREYIDVQIPYENVQETIIVDDTPIEENIVVNTISQPIRAFTRVKRQKLNINFESNSAWIRSESKKLVMRYAQFLNDNPDIKVIIEGYTDGSGLRSKNIKLSEKRAKSVVNLLIRLGVEKSRLRAVGKGDLNPIADNATPQGRAENRRIEAVIKGL